MSYYFLPQIYNTIHKNNIKIQITNTKNIDKTTTINK